MNSSVKKRAVEVGKVEAQGGRTAKEKGQSKTGKVQMIEEFMIGREDKTNDIEGQQKKRKHRRKARRY